MYVHVYHMEKGDAGILVIKYYNHPSEREVDTLKK